MKRITQTHYACKRTSNASCANIGEAFSQLDIDDSALLRRVFVVGGGELRKDGDHATRGLISSSCPRLNPARRRAASGTTTGFLFLRATVIVIGYVGDGLNFHLHDSRYAHCVNPRRGARRPNVGGRRTRPTHASAWLFLIQPDTAIGAGTTLSVGNQPGPEVAVFPRRARSIAQRLCGRWRRQSPASVVVVYHDFHGLSRNFGALCKECVESEILEGHEVVGAPGRTHR